MILMKTHKLQTIISKTLMMKLINILIVLVRVRRTNPINYLFLYTLYKRKNKKAKILYPFLKIKKKALYRNSKNPFDLNDRQTIMRKQLENLAKKTLYLCNRS